MNVYEAMGEAKGLFGMLSADIRMADIEHVIEVFDTLDKVAEEYRRLCPPPEDWPKWATYCVIHANGLQYFMNGGEPKAKPGYNAWDFPPLANRSDFYREAELYDGIDWRACVWKNPNIGKGE